MLNRLLHRLRGFGREVRGIAAVEFALLAPLMFLLYFGMIELCEAMMADRRTNHAVSTIGDLVAQSIQPMHTNNYADAFAAANTILAPFPTAPLQLRVTSVTAGPAPNLAPTVDWSEVPSGQTGLTPLKTGSVVTLPPNLLVNPGDNVVMAEGHYTYTSPIGFVVKGLLNFTPTYYLRPRTGSMVGDCNSNPQPTGC